MRVAAVVLICSLVAHGLAAQEPAAVPSATVELRGRIFLAGDTMALRGALIEVVGEGISGNANLHGQYRLTGLRVGRHELRVRLIGLASRTLFVDLATPGIHVHDIAMSRLPNALATVRIEGKLRTVPPRFDDVYRRMATQTGVFFTAEDIDKLKPWDVSSLLWRVPTFRQSSQGITFARCDQGGAYALSMTNRGKSGVQIYINGFRATGRSSGPSEDEQKEVLSRVAISEIQAIEVYSGVARIPAEFLEDACAVIAIWTK